MGLHIAFRYNGDSTLNAVTDTQGRTTSIGYGALNAPTLIANMFTPLRYTAGFAYNPAQTVSSYTDLAGGVYRYGYDANNRLTQLTDPKGNVAQFAYDAGGRVTSLTLAAGTGAAEAYAFAYNAGSTVVTDPNHHQTTYYHDAQGRLTQATDALGDSFHWAWTADNQVSQYTDAKGQAFAYGYDANNNPTSVALPTGATTSATYGTVANIPNFYVPISTTDARGNQTTYQYDGVGDLTKVATLAMVNSQTTTSTITASAAYNANGTPSSSTDFNGGTTTYGYDAKGNLTSVAPPAPMGSTAYAYDTVGRVQSVTDGRGYTTSFQYDNLDRVINYLYADRTATGFSYDADGNVSNMQESNTGTTYYYYYDARNRQTQKNLPASLGGGTIAYGYDPAGNLATYQDAGGTVTYHYNAGDELDSLLDPSGAKTTFAYDPNGHRTSTAYPDGVTMALGYDASQRIASVTATNAGATLVGLAYGYATGGKDTPQVQQVRENDAPGVGPSPTRNYTTTYAYDPRGLMLTWQVHNNANNTTVHDYEYQFDADGNRTQIVADATISPPPPNPKTTLTYNPANELTSTSIYPLATSGTPTATATWTWDAAGELTANTGYAGISGPLTVQYNQHGQTTAMSDAYGNMVPMAYTGPGQAERTGAGWSNQPSPPTGKPAEFGSTSYTYSALGLMSRADTTGTTYYTYDPAGLPVSERTPGGTYYFLYNGLGDVAMLVDAAGSVTAITSPCPTGNQSGDQWQQPGSHALDELVFQGSGASGTGWTQVLPILIYRRLCHPGHCREHRLRTIYRLPERADLR